MLLFHFIISKVISSKLSKFFMVEKMAEIKNIHPKYFYLYFPNELSAKYMKVEKSI